MPALREHALRLEPRQDGDFVLGARASKHYGPGALAHEGPRLLALPGLGVMIG